MFDEAFPDDKQIGGNPIQDLEKIKHYCDLEIKHLKDRIDDKKSKN